MTAKQLTALASLDAQTCARGLEQRPFGRAAEILLVEDNPGDVRLTREALKSGRIHHRLTVLFDGVEAIEFLHRSGVYARAPRPDLILLDLSLPKMDGRELLTRVKANDDLREISVIVLTASEAHADWLMGQLVHVDAYLIKPVDPDNFLATVRALKRAWLEELLTPR